MKELTVPMFVDEDEWLRQLAAAPVAIIGLNIVLAPTALVRALCHGWPVGHGQESFVRDANQPRLLNNKHSVEQHSDKRCYLFLFVTALAEPYFDLSNVHTILPLKKP